MSFLARSVSLRNFRNIVALDLEPAEGLTILAGRNATGKTNCIEGMHLLAHGGSFRHACLADLIKKDEERALLSMRCEGEKRQVETSMTLCQHTKTYQVNGKRVTFDEYEVPLPTVLFQPDDLMVVKGAAGHRRELFDGFGIQLNRLYGKIAADYQEALLQRNALLKDASHSGVAPSADLLDAWTDALVASGSMLFLYRRALVARIAPHIAEIYGDVSGGEALDLVYQTRSFEGGDVQDGPTLSRAQVTELMRSSLDARRDDEIRRARTLLGPHLDDVTYLIEGQDARIFGSQGQQRSAVLATKLAQVRLIEQMRGQYPLFLLDDVMSELDARRRSHLYELISGGVQTIITTANLDYFTQSEISQARVIDLEQLI